MDYKLAKELKDAGFPQRDRGNFVSPTDIEIINSPLAIYVPTLEELIEACGHNIESIIQRGNGNGDNWEARSKTQRCNATTLEEVVARLWLALNKKDLPANQ